VGDGRDKSEFYGLIGQKAERPAGMSFRGTRASKSGDLGTHLPVDGGRSAWTVFIEQRRVEPFFEVAPFYIEDSSTADLQSLSNLIRVVATMQEVEYTGASLSPSRSRSSPQ
jgi:hypothetical protein